MCCTAPHKAAAGAGWGTPWDRTPWGAAEAAAAKAVANVISGVVAKSAAASAVSLIFGALLYVRAWAVYDSSYTRLKDKLRRYLKQTDELLQPAAAGKKTKKREQQVAGATAATDWSAGV